MKLYRNRYSQQKTATVWFGRCAFSRTAESGPAVWTVLHDKMAMKRIYSTLKEVSFFPWIQENLNKEVHLLFLKKVVPVHAMTALRGGGTGPFTLNISGKLRWLVGHTPRPLCPWGKKPLIPTAQEVVWAPQSVWTSLREAKFGCTCPGLNPNHPACSLVPIMTKLLRLRLYAVLAVQGR